MSALEPQSLELLMCRRLVHDAQQGGCAQRNVFFLLRSRARPLLTSRNAHAAADAYTSSVISASSKAPGRRMTGAAVTYTDLCSCAIAQRLIRLV